MKERAIQLFADRRDWPACIFGASFFFVIWFYSENLYETLTFSGFFALFNLLPGMWLLDALFPQWRRQDSPPLLLIAFAPVAGVIVLLPWWAVSLKWGYFLIPVVSLLLLISSSRTRNFFPKSEWPEWPRMTYLAIALLGAPLVSFALIWVEGLNPHLLYQAAISAKLDAGYPPEFPFIAHVPLAYNYVAHVWMTAASYITGIPIENIVVYSAPALLIYSSAAGLAAVALYAGVGVWISGLVVTCAFWYAGWTPIGAQLFGRAFTWSAILLVGPLMAFCAALVLIVALAEWFSNPDKQQKTSAYVFAFLVTLIVTGSRAPGALILICAVSGFVLWEMVFKRRFNWFSVGMVVVMAAATGLGLIVFLRYGSAFDMGGFTKISATPFAYLGSFSFFWLPKLLIAKGLAPYWAGVVQFVILIILQAGLLTPFLFWSINRPRLYSPIEVLLLGAGVAGIGAIFFLESPGGSHLSFFHYTTLAFTLLGGIALSKIASMRTRQFYAALATACVLAFVQVREIPFRALSGMVYRLASATSPKRMVTRQCPGEPRLETTESALPDGATVVLPADLDMCARLRLMIHNPRANFYLEESLRLIAEWDTSLKPDLARKVALLNSGPKALAAALPAPSYVMVRRGEQVGLDRVDSSH
jgi:hypothetical protein